MHGAAFALKDGTCHFRFFWRHFLVCVWSKKLRYIQLYEADFNFFQQFIFGREAMNLLTDNGFLPEEHFSKNDSTTEDAKFNKTLTEDLSRQAQHPMAVVLVDTTQCYDRMNHVIMVLLWYALMGKMGPIRVLLICMQNTRLIQCTYTLW